MKSIACTISYGKTEIDYELLMMNRKLLEIAAHPDKDKVLLKNGYFCIEATSNQPDHINQIIDA